MSDLLRFDATLTTANHILTLPLLFTLLIACTAQWSGSAGIIFAARRELRNRARAPLGWHRWAGLFRIGERVAAAWIKDVINHAGRQ